MRNVLADVLASLRRNAVLAATPALLAAATLALPGELVSQESEDRPRVRDLGVEVGIFDTGQWNAITDVEGVRVGQTTVWEGDDVRTGVTAIFPHEENPFRSRVPAAVHVGNGFGKLAGSLQVQELGEIETPVLLTCTLCVWRGADAMVEWMLEQDGMGNVRSINPLVGETNDGRLNDIRARPIGPGHVRQALETADTGPVEEGAVGAGTGTRSFGWKSGIGTASRVLPDNLGGYTVGVLVQSNFGGVLTVDGAPVGQELGQYSFRGSVEGNSEDEGPEAQEDEEGSIMIVIATDAPVTHRNLERMAKRAMMGLSRTGSFASNGSGDFIIAFSTAEEVRRERGADRYEVEELTNSDVSSLFQAVVEGTEEAIYNSLTKATTVTGAGGTTIEAIDIDELTEVLQRYNVVP